MENRLGWNKNGYVELSMDLHPYIDAYANKVSYPEAFRALRSSLEEKVQRATVNNIWYDICDLYTESLPNVGGHSIKDIPAVYILSEHFAEIFMNSIDEILQANHADKSNSSVLQMAIRFDETSEKGLMTVDIFDNGRGFPKEFLDKINNHRSEYILNYNGRQNLKKIDSHIGNEKQYDGPPLIGGRGLGMRFFLADAQNDKLLGMGFHKRLVPAYQKSEDYSLAFMNSQDNLRDYRGAWIRFTTPITPRQDIEEHVTLKTPASSPDSTSSKSCSSLGLSISTDFDSDDDNTHLSFK